MTIEEDFDIPETGAVFTFGKSRFAENVPSKFWIKNDIICDVACGDEHTAIITGSGRVFTIGNNGSGQLGLQNNKPVSRPCCVKGGNTCLVNLYLSTDLQALKPERIIRIACGRAHTVAASEKCHIFSWGYNGEGQLGTGDQENKNSPIQICQLSGVPQQLSAGASHSLLLTDEGEVLAWGCGAEGQLGMDSDIELKPTRIPLGNKIIAIACGYYHSIALTESGDVLVWGEDEYGKLGLPEHLRKYYRHPQPLSIEEKVAMVSAGSSHSLVLTESGRLLTCGTGTNGQLGQGPNIAVRTSFKPVIGVEDKRFIYTSSGDNHSAAISDTGLVYTWGCGRHGKLCLGEQKFSSQHSPVVVSRLRHLTAVKVACGGCHTMVLGYRRLERESYPGNNLLRAGEVSTNDVKGKKNKQNVIDDILLKGPPFKRTIQPTLPIDERRDDVTTQGTQWEDPELLNKCSSPSGDERLPASKTDTDLETSRRSQKKASTFARFFSIFSKRNSRLTIQSGESKLVSKPIDDSEDQCEISGNSESQEKSSALDLTFPLDTVAIKSLCEEGNNINSVSVESAEGCQDSSQSLSEHEGKKIVAEENHEQPYDDYGVNEVTDKTKSKMCVVI